MLLNRDYAVYEICGEPRSKRIHRRCSRILQQRYDAEEWAKILANVRKDELGSTMERSRSVRINGRTKK